MSTSRARLLLGCVVALALLGGGIGNAASAADASTRGARPSPVGSDRFAAGQYYRGDFPDPSVLRWGSKYYAYSTTVAGLNLPVIVSTDLLHWRVVGEGLTRPARWAALRRVGNRQVATTWAPTVARFGDRFVHAYATRTRAKDHRMCISFSTSRHPWGGFVDRTRRPFLCPSTRGAIDPHFFTAPDGARYLIWKSEQTPVYPSQLWSTRLSSTGTRFVGPSSKLLTTQDPWEGRLIENPAMIAYAGRYYLFYSAASYANSTYATGYATCATPLGPCTRAASTPLLATGGLVSGPGGAMPFVDAARRLRLAYAAWDYGNTGYPKGTACLQSPLGCPQRRLHVATLATSPDGSGALVVTSRGW